MKRTIQSGNLSVSLNFGDQGLSLCELKDQLTGHCFYIGNAPLFLLTAEELSSGEESVFSSQTDFKASLLEGVGKWTVVAESISERLKGVTAEISIVAEEEKSRIIFNTTLLSTNTEMTLKTCDYPILSFSVTPEVRFLSPYGCGVVMKADSELFGHGYQSVQDYPSYGASFQFMDIWDESVQRGIYYGTHDAAPAYKKFSFLRDVNAPEMEIKASMPLTGISHGKNSQKLAGECVWQLHDGNWYDATLIYKSWMEKNACWLPKMQDGCRADAAWMKDIDAWWLVHINGDTFADDIINATKEIGVKTAVHLYLWHQNPFDNDYPHYFPEKECIRKELKKLQEVGIRVIPYINGRLWDTHDRGAEDWMYTKVARPYATKDRNGQIFTESYSSKESDGSPVVLSIMCPSTALWQNTVVDITSQLMNRVGFDGVYIDQIAAAKPQLCCDPTHNHQPGGGSWWMENYYHMMDRVSYGNENKVVATECTSEMFMKHIPGYLSWLWVKNDQVPVFPVLYSDKVFLFGICYHSFTDLDDSCCRIFAAQSLLYGEQMGWISPEKYREMPCHGFFNHLVSVRAQLHNVLSHGIMLRPPVVEDDAARLQSDKDSQAYFHTVDYPAVQGATWREKETGIVYQLFVNAQKEDANLKISTTVSDGEYELHGDISGKIKVCNGCAEMKIPGESVVWIEAQG